MASKDEIEIKVGQKFELVLTEEMWKDNKSGVHLRNPGRYKISRPIDADYRTQLEWFSANRFKNPKDVLYKEDEGQNWFEVTKGMDVSRIKLAVKKGILIPKGTGKIPLEKKNQKNLFRTDTRTGTVVYDGPNKNLYLLLQKNTEKDIVDIIVQMVDPRHLEILLDMEQKGWNTSCSPRKNIIEALEKQLDKNAIGISSIKEEDNKVETIKDINKK